MNDSLRTSRVMHAARWIAVLAILALCGCSTVRNFRAEWRIRRGDTQLADDNLEAALASFQRAAQITPKMAVAHSRLGGLYERMGEYDEAINSYGEAVRYDPYSFVDAFQLARLFHFVDRTVDAIQAYLHVVQLNPDDFNSQLNLGVCYQESGDLDQAIERFRKAIQIDPQQPYAYVNLGVALDGQQRHYEAIRAYKEALERDGQQTMVLVNIARTYMNQDRLKMARNALQVLRLDPHLAIAHEALGYCLFRMRDFEASRLSYEQALSYDWRLPRTHAGLGSVHMLMFLDDTSQTEARDTALEHWHRSLELDTDQVRVRRLIAQYQPKRSDPGERLLDWRAERSSQPTLDQTDRPGVRPVAKRAVFGSPTRAAQRQLGAPAASQNKRDQNR